MEELLPLVAEPPRRLTDETPGLRRQLATAFWLLNLLAAGVKIAYVLGSGPDLFFEEAQYWLWSKRPDWSYYSKPPLVAWVNLLSTHFWGDTVLAVRLSAIGCGFLVCYHVFRIAQEQFNSNRVALLAVLLLNAMPFFLLASLFFTTDSLLMVGWIAALRYYLRATRTARRGDWLRMWVAIALGMLAKFPMALFGLVVLLDTWSGPSRSRLFGRLLLVGSAVLAGLLPALYWNSQHQWVTFSHVSGLAAGSSSPGLLHPKAFSFLLEFLGGQVASWSVFLFLLVVTRWNRLKAYSTTRTVRRLLLGPLVVLLGFGLLALHKRVEVNWPSFAYLTLPVGAAYLLKAGYVRRLPIGNALLLSALTLQLALHPWVLDRMAGRRVIPVRADPLHRMAGWQELGQQVSALVAPLPEGAYFLGSDSYHVASELAFYVEGHPMTFCLYNPDRRMNQFDVWPGPTPAQRTLGIFVTDGLLPDYIRRQTARSELIRRVPIRYRGAVVRTISLYRLHGYTGTTPARFGTH